MQRDMLNPFIFLKRQPVEVFFYGYNGNNTRGIVPGVPALVRIADGGQSILCPNMIEINTDHRVSSLLADHHALPRTLTQQTGHFSKRHLFDVEGLDQSLVVLDMRSRFLSPHIRQADRYPKQTERNQPPIPTCHTKSLRSILLQNSHILGIAHRMQFHLLARYRSNLDINELIRGFT
jgi:hypothetical protein